MIFDDDVGWQMPGRYELFAVNGISLGCRKGLATTHIFKMQFYFILSPIFFLRFTNWARGRCRTKEKPLKAIEKQSSNPLRLPTDDGVVETNRTLTKTSVGQSTDKCLQCVHFGTGQTGVLLEWVAHWSSIRIHLIFQAAETVCIIAWSVAGGMKKNDGN